MLVLESPSPELKSAAVSVPEPPSKLSEPAPPVSRSLPLAPHRRHIHPQPRVDGGHNGEYERAEAFIQGAQERLWEIGGREIGGLSNSLLGFVALSRNDPDRAEDLCVEAIRELQERAQASGVIHTLDILASVAAAKGEIRKAARLWGAAAGSREDPCAPWLPEDRELIEPHIDAARTRLEEATWREEWEKGRSMNLDQAVGYALEGGGDCAIKQG